MLLTLLACVHNTPAPTPPVSDAFIAERFEELHAPIYGVYELGQDRDKIWELLDASFAGRALTHEYIEHYTTLATMAQEETAIQVIRVDYERVTVLDRSPGSVRVEADWSVGGVVTHQAHKHSRVNRYVAVYTLALRPDGQWRIVDTHMRDLERVRSVLSAYTKDDAFLLDELPSSGAGLMDPLDMLDAGLGVKEERP